MEIKSQLINTNILDIKTFEDVTNLIEYAKKCKDMCKSISTLFLEVYSRNGEKLYEGTNVLFDYGLNDEMELGICEEAKNDPNKMLILNNLINQINAKSEFPIFLYTESDFINLESKTLSIVIDPILIRSFDLSKNKFHHHFILNMLFNPGMIPEIKIALKSNEWNFLDQIIYPNKNMQELFAKYGRNVKLVKMDGYYDLLDVALINLDYNVFHTFFNAVENGETTHRYHINSCPTSILGFILSSLEKDLKYTITFKPVENEADVVIIEAIKNHKKSLDEDHVLYENLDESSRDYLNLMARKEIIKETCDTIVQLAYNIFKLLLSHPNSNPIMKLDILNEMLKVEINDIISEKLLNFTRSQLLCFKNELLNHLAIESNWNLIGKYIDIEIYTDGIYVCISKSVIGKKKYKELLLNELYPIDRTPIEIDKHLHLKKSEERTQLIAYILQNIDSNFEFNPNTVIYNIQKEYHILNDLIDKVMYRTEEEHILSKNSYICIDDLFQPEALGFDGGNLDIFTATFSYQDFRVKLLENNLSVVLVPLLLIKKHPIITFDVLLISKESI